MIYINILEYEIYYYFMFFCNRNLLLFICNILYFIINIEYYIIDNDEFYF